MLAGTRGRPATARPGESACRGRKGGVRKTADTRKRLNPQPFNQLLLRGESFNGREGGCFVSPGRTWHFTTLKIGSDVFFENLFSPT